MKVNLIEISESIHGELPHQGAPCIIFRVDTCNLSCYYCDVKYTLNNKERTTSFSIDELKSIIIKSNLKHFLITGGEPLLYQDFWLNLITNFQMLSRHFTIETNGTIYVDSDFYKYNNTTLVIDWKLHEPDSFNLCNLQRLRAHDIVKFVYNSGTEDLDKAFSLIKRHINPLKIKTTIVFSPILPSLTNFLPKEDVAKIIHMQKETPLLDLKFQLQIHKLIKVP